MRKETIKHFYTKHERYISPVAFFAGFVWDSFTLRRIDLWFENLFLLVHLFISGAVIFLLNARETGRFQKLIPQKIAGLLPFAIQFSFGALFSAFFIFYSRSASLAASWPFILFLAGLLVGNEIFRKRYHRLVFQLSVYFIALYSYSIFAVPVLIGKMGAGVFVISGFVSIALIALFIYVLSLAAAWKLRRAWRPLAFVILIIYFAFHFLYFTNIIPPIPLSLKESGIYHFVSRMDNGQYVVHRERASGHFWEKLFGTTIHWVPGSSVYSYSSVFAPAKINITIYHRWSYFDEKKGEWVVINRLGFSIAGGRDGGYRGYTMKTVMRAGKWRVDVITERDQILGRTVFYVIEVGSPPILEIDTR